MDYYIEGKTEDVDFDNTVQEIIKTIERGHKMQEDTKQAIIALNEQTKTLFDMIKLNNEAIMRVFTLLKDLADILEGEKP